MGRGPRPLIGLVAIHPDTLGPNWARALPVVAGNRPHSEAPGPIKKRGFAVSGEVIRGVCTLATDTPGQHSSLQRCLYAEGDYPYGNMYVVQCPLCIVRTTLNIIFFAEFSSRPVRGPLSALCSVCSRAVDAHTAAPLGSAPSCVRAAGLFTTRGQAPPTVCVRWSLSAPLSLWALVSAPDGNTRSGNYVYALWWILTGRGEGGLD